MADIIYDRRIVRARRDGAAYRIASAIADGEPVDQEDLIIFRAARKEHRDMIKSQHPSTRKSSE